MSIWIPSPLPDHFSSLLRFIFCCSGPLDAAGLHSSYDSSVFWHPLLAAAGTREANDEQMCVETKHSRTKNKINKSKTKTIYIYSHLSTFLLNCSKQGREPGSVRGGGGDRMGGAEGVSLRSFRVCVRRWWGSALNCWMVVPLLTGVAAIPSTVEELRPQEAGV